MITYARVGIEKLKSGFTEQIGEKYASTDDTHTNSAKSCETLP